MRSINLMRVTLAAIALVGVSVVSACNRDTGAILFTPGPTAYVRFVNAVPDTGGQDWRFIDFVENTPNALNLTYRGVFPGASYQAITPGARHLRIFQSSPNQAYDTPTLTTPAIVSTIFIDTTITLVAGQHYTLAAVGSVRSGTARLLLLEDNYSDPGASVAVRIVNLGVGGVDVYDSATATPLASGLATYASTTWLTHATGPLTLRALAAGAPDTATALFSVAAPAGVAADRTLNLTAVGGSRIAGSAFTAFLVPAGVGPGRAIVALSCPSVGQPTPNVSVCASPGIVFAVDKYPPSGF